MYLNRKNTGITLSLLSIFFLFLCYPLFFFFVYFFFYFPLFSSSFFLILLASLASSFSSSSFFWLFLIFFYFFCFLFFVSFSFLISRRRFPLTSYWPFSFFFSHVDCCVSILLSYFVRFLFTILRIFISSKCLHNVVHLHTFIFVCFSHAAFSMSHELRRFTPKLSEIVE